MSIHKNHLEAKEAEEYEHAVADLLLFLAYVAEPSESARQQLGPFILLFIIFLLIPAYYLNNIKK